MQSFNSDKYDVVENFRFAAQLSEMAYHSEDDIKSGIAELGGDAKSVIFLHGKNLFGFVAKFSDFAFIVFRGTQTRQDWKDNLDIRKLHTFCGDIHNGFASCIETLSLSVIHAVEVSFDKPYKLCLTGHSKGGALAVLATALLVRNGYDPAAIYTFGQPKVGGKGFVKWWEANVSAKYYRVVNGIDIVPHLPPGPEDIPYFLIITIGYVFWVLLFPFTWTYQFIIKIFLRKSI